MAGSQLMQTTELTKIDYCSRLIMLYALWLGRGKKFLHPFFLFFIKGMLVVYFINFSSSNCTQKIS